MMHSVPRLLVDLALVLGVAGVTSLLFHRLRIPVVLGYMLAGLVVGPHVPIPLVAGRENVQTLADLGVILLMFSIGLEFSLQRLFRAGPAALLMGSIQVGFAILLGGWLSRALGWSHPESLFAGGAIAISSTMVAAKLLEDFPQGKAIRETIFSVLVVQDLFAILLLTALTTYAKLGGLPASELIYTAAKLVVFLFLVLGLGRMVFPRFLRWVSDHAKSESLLISNVGLCFVCSLGAAYAGFPLALGAFLAGMLASESGRARTIEHLIMPLRDLFTSIFFVAVGMMIDPKALLPMILPIVLFSALVIVGNGLSLTSSGLLAGLGLRTSFCSAMALGQMGEFGYILMAIGTGAGLVRPELYTVSIAVGVLTTSASPLLMKYASRCSTGIERCLPCRFRDSLELYRSWAESLRRRGIRHSESRWVRRPAWFLLLDILLLLVLLPTFDKLMAIGIPLMENHLHWGFRSAQLIAAALLGVLAALLVSGILRQERVLARDLAVLAPSGESGGVARRGRHLLAGGLRIALLLMVGLPFLAIVQAFTPDSTFLAVALAVFFAAILLQLRMARHLSHASPGGSEWLLAQIRSNKLGEEETPPKKRSLIKRFKWRRPSQ